MASFSRQYVKKLDTNFHGLWPASARSTPIALTADVLAQLHLYIDNIVIMTNLSLPPVVPARRASRAKTSGSHWVLADAKAHFSQLVRQVRSEGPQHVTVHGRDEVVVIAAEEFRRLKGASSGQALVDAFRASPHQGIDIAPKRLPMPVRNVEL